MVLKLKHFGRFFILIGWLVLSFPATGFPVAPGLVKTSQRQGAANLEELSAALFSAIKTNDFNQLSTFFPGQAELNLLKKGRDKNLQLMAEEITPEQVQASFKTDFEGLMQTSANEMMNWSEQNLAETSPVRFKGAQKSLAPVKLFLSAGENQAQHFLIYEAIKIRNRYYLFQHISLNKST